jgi:hypothetical protein
MTRKDYIIIADALRIQYYNSQSVDIGGTKERFAGVLDCAKEIADALGRDNARFNREHFLSVVRGEKELNSHPSRGAK